MHRVLLEQQAVRQQVQAELVKPQARRHVRVKVKPLERYQTMIVSNIAILLTVYRMTPIMQTSFRQL